MQALSIGHQGENVIILTEIVGLCRDLALFIAERFKQAEEDLAMFALVIVLAIDFYKIRDKNFSHNFYVFVLYIKIKL